MKKIVIEIDGQRVEAEEGTRLLWSALAAGIYIPHLCAGRELDFHPASCRLCWVEVEGRGAAPACTVTAVAGLMVRTRSERVDRLVRTGFALLMSTHRLDCGSCPANHHCALQEIARRRKLPLRPKRIEWSLDWPPTALAPTARMRRARIHLALQEPAWPVDLSQPRFGLDRNHCILCGQCIFVCNEIVRCRVLDFQRRGRAMVVNTFQGRPLAEQEDCAGCLRCVQVCPVGALFHKG